MIPNNIVAVFEYPNQIRPAVRAFIDNTDPTLIKDITKNTSSSVVITLTDNTIYYFIASFKGLFSFIREVTHSMTPFNFFFISISRTAAGFHRAFGRCVFVLRGVGWA